MNQNTNNKNKGLNTVDILIILVLIACVLFAVNVVINDIFSVSSHQIEYVLKITDAAPGSKSALSVGDKIYEKTSNTQIGTISQIIITPAQATIFDYDKNRFVTTEINSKYDLYITVNAIASLRNNIYHIADVNLIANNSLQIAFPFLFEDLKIISVNKR